jgi:hypothetical protein
MGNSEGKRLTGRPRYECENNIKIDLREIGCRYGLYSFGSG